MWIQSAPSGTVEPVVQISTEQRWPTRRDGQVAVGVTSIILIATQQKQQQVHHLIHFAHNVKRKSNAKYVERDSHRLTLTLTVVLSKKKNKTHTRMYKRENMHKIHSQTLATLQNKMLSYRRETALQGALQFSPKVEDWNWETI